MSCSDTIAAAPFDKPISCTSIILLSCDNVSFYVSKEVLILSSSFFRTMLSLEQPSQCNHPVIPVSENSRTLDYLLRLCYPIVPPSPLSDLSDVHQVLDAAIKYDMDRAVWNVKKELHTLGEADPPRMFAIAVQLRLEADAVAAANMWRNECLLLPYDEVVSKSYRQEMDQISAGSFRRFLLYTCSETNDDCLCYPPLGNKGDSGDSSRDGCPVEEPFNMMRIDIGTVYDAHPDVILRSKDNIDIHVHRAVLNIISSTNTLFTATTNIISDNGTPVVECNEYGIILVKLLQLCYPLGETRFTHFLEQMKDMYDIDSLEQDLEVYGLTTKYRFANDIQAVALKKMMSHVSSNALGVFFIAMRLARRSEAQVAAKVLMRQCSKSRLQDLYEKNMERVGSAKLYYDLISYLGKHRILEVTKGSDTVKIPIALAFTTIPAPVVLKKLEQEYEKFQKRLEKRWQWGSANSLAMETTEKLVESGMKSNRCVIPLMQLEPSPVAHQSGVTDGLMTAS
ncbi:hypothetical protein QCA50_019191 [Cerrena zonata]|uniref:BTB domain-containing protein n=1 Tax=Cerrena zonata TaxID=2478898 RepID=A0AAW0FEK5_9APHY